MDLDADDEQGGSGVSADPPAAPGRMLVDSCLVPRSALRRSSSPRAMDLDTDDEQGGSDIGVSAHPLAAPGCMVVDTDDEDGGSGVSADPLAAPDSASSDTDNCSSVEGKTEMAMSLHSSSGEEGVGESSGALTGMQLDSESDSHEGKTFKCANGWQPGRDCGRFDDFSEPLVKVILSNLFLNASRLPSKTAKQVLQALLPKEEVLPTRNFPDWVVQVMAGVSRSRGRRVHDQVRKNNWDPVETAPGDEADERAPAAETPFQFASDCTTPLERSLWAMAVRVKEAVHIARKGRPDAEYVEAMRRLQSHGLVLGSKFIWPKFVETVEEQCVAALRSLAGKTMNQLVPSMGIPADFVLVFDGVSIGARMFSRNESMLVIGAVIMSEQGRGKWRSESQLLAAPSSAQHHTAQEQANLVLREVVAHPAGLSVRRLSERVGQVGSDGAASCGGEQRKVSALAAEVVWQQIHPQTDPMTPAIAPATEWDLFHRIDLAGSHAIRSTPAAVEIFDVARVLASLFGVGEGRVVLRSVADLIGERRSRVPDQGGTRKIVALGNTIEHLLKNHRTFHAAMHARLGLVKAGRSGQTQNKLIGVGRRISSLGFVTFALGAGDILRVNITPLAMLSQKVEGSNRGDVVACRSSLEGLKSTAAALKRLQFWCFLVPCLCTHFSRPELQNLWRAVAYSVYSRWFPRLALCLRQLLFAREFGGCTLATCQPVLNQPRAQSNFLAPFCQCASMRQRPNRGAWDAHWRRAVVTLRRKDGSHPREVKVPEWVAHSSHSKSEMLMSRTLECQVPRLDAVAVESRPPLQIQGVSRFGTGCSVPAALLQSTPEILQSLHELQSFVQRLAYHLEAFCLGDYGVSEQMRAVAQADMICMMGALFSERIGIWFLLCS